MSQAVVFPGQGSQSVGMLQALRGTLPSLPAALATASRVLDLDLDRIVQHGPEDLLNRTDVTQPVLLACSVALWQALPSGVRAETRALAGHSLGEYSALVAAESIGFESALHLVHQRGLFMQESVHGQDTAMAAVLGLEDEAVIAVCESARQNAGAGQTVEAVNFNCPGQTVIAGTSAAVSAALDFAKTAGARKVIRLSVSVPSHSSLMKPAAEKLSALLQEIEIQSPTIPVFHNIDGKAEGSPSGIRDRLVRQLYSPVLWSQTIQNLCDQGMSRFIECGPGKVLAGLIKKTDRSAEMICLSDTESWTRIA